MEGNIFSALYCYICRHVTQATLRVTKVHDPIAVAAASVVADQSLDGTEASIIDPVSTTPSIPINYLDVNVNVNVTVLPALCTPPAVLPPLKPDQIAKYSQPNPLKTANKNTASKGNGILLPLLTLYPPSHILPFLPALLAHFIL